LIDIDYPVFVLALHGVEYMVLLNPQSLFTLCTFYSHISVLHMTTGKFEILFSCASAQKLEQTCEAMVGLANRPAVA